MSTNDILSDKGIPQDDDTTPRNMRQHIYAIMILSIFGLVPTIAYFSSNRIEYRNESSSSSQDSGECLETQFSGAPRGFKSLFQIDDPVARLPFATAKFVDVVWDVCIGRGLQGIAWFVSYEIFSKALLRVMEISPAPFTTFAGVAIDGCSFTTLWTIVRDLWRYRGARVKILFAYIAISSLWILSFPTLASAMTGYINTNTSYYRTANQLVPRVSTHSGYAFYDGERIGLSNGTCLPSAEVDTSLRDAYGLASARDAKCPCLLPNNTLANPSSYIRDYLGCTFNTTDTNATFNRTSVDTGYPCTIDFNVTQDGTEYHLGRTFVDMVSTNCYGDHQALPQMLEVVCLPNDDESAYLWGFSVMLTTVVLAIHCAWAISMYALWMDAMSNSHLVRQGMTLNPLKAAFAVSAAAEERLSMAAAKMVPLKKEDMKPLKERTCVVDHRHLDQEDQRRDKTGPVRGTKSTGGDVEPSSGN